MSTTMVTIEAHPKLDALVFTTSFADAVGAIDSPADLLAAFDVEADAPVASCDDIRKKVRGLLRHGGYKPTGRGKPASEYLLRAAAEGKLGPINVAVDVLNVVSLHSGLPISVIDLERAKPPFTIAFASEGTRYVFNASDQEIDASGLVCLFDAQGACANAVKDCQRTKTDATTTRTLSVIWGTKELPGYTERVSDWYREWLGRLGAETALCGLA